MENRKQEIMDAVRELYETMSFKDITMKEIAVLTTFSRPSIYNYFHTREEIFLAVYEEEYDSLSQALKEAKGSGIEDLADVLGRALEQRPMLIRLFSTNLYDLETCSRMENLTAYKAAYGRFVQVLEETIRRFLPDLPEEDLHTFVYAFLPMMYGVFPFAFISEKQKSAMQAAGYEPYPYGIYELIRSGVSMLLK